MSADDQVLYSVDGHVATITLNRPDRLNAISGPMLAQLSKRLLDAERDRNARVIVITGAGRGFCAGLDLQDASAGTGIGGGGNADAATGGAELELRTAPPIVLHEIDTPTICALNGGAAGYGMDLALGCDIRIAGESAKLAAAFTKRGVLPESGGTWLLPRLVGWSKASEIIFTGRTLSAKECLDLGLVSDVVPDATLADAARALAEEIAGNAPLAVRASKRMMRAAMSEEFGNHVHHVFLELLPLFRSKDFQEGMMSFLEKRPPSFEGR
ncbi:MAG: enoyl-CoA hydratase/isomerase family protein [Actinobacteria bacterium]|nr:enoyl-CoA hydratase/isomerase family protein [Actinomycetota bacterium]MBV9253715.1 enoyl-CoA hydratase/isomerase family protein [Actinomycetota bacterium]